MIALAAAATRDVQQSVRFLKANVVTYGIDPTRVAMEGFPAPVALALATGVAARPPYVGPLSDYAASVAAALLTGAFLTPALSTITLTTGEAPELLFQYAYDNATHVTASYAFQTCDALRAAGDAYYEAEQAGTGHTSSLVAGGPLWTSELGPFIWDQLRLGPRRPDTARVPAERHRMARVDRATVHGTRHRRHATVPCMPGGDIEFVLFDLGGVVIELGGIGALQELVGVASDAEVWDRWLASPWVREFESGRCSAREFAVGVVVEWGLALSPRRFLEAFRNWPIGPYPGARSLLADVQRSVPIGCLSNTNALHWEWQSVEWPILRMFDRTFLSFELGLVKPDREIFRVVADRIPADRAQVLYLDDVAANVDAARSFGFRSAQVRGIAGCRPVLVEAGLLSP